MSNQQISDLREKAEQGDATAQLKLGLLYYHGQGVLLDDAMARQWFEKAATQGNATAQDRLGSIYYCGEGVPQDYIKAREWYEKAARQGDAEAQFHLGWLYAKGYGVPQDYAMARQWFEQAAAQDHAGAQCQIGQLYYVGQGVPQDYVKAYMWYSLAATSTGSVQKLAVDSQDEVAHRMTSAQLIEAQRLVQQCQARQFKHCHREGFHSSQATTLMGEGLSERLTCQEFAEILAWSVMRQIKENRDRAPNPQLRCFAQSVNADADTETIDNEILFLLSFCLSQICAFHIDDQPYLDELIPRFYHTLASQRGSDAAIFGALAISRYKGYLEPYALDKKGLVQHPEGMIPWKFMLSQLGKNLHSEFDFATNRSDFVPASMGLQVTFECDTEFIKGTLDKLDFGKGTS
jgi:hypothetical protein